VSEWVSEWAVRTTQEESNCCGVLLTECVVITAT
jgi:hypothetical protein